VGFRQSRDRGHHGNHGQRVQCHGNERYAGQPTTSSLNMENSTVSLRRQRSDYLGEQVIVLFLSLGSNFVAYSTKLSKVVSRVKGREATTVHREEVGTKDKAQAVVVINRNQGMMEGQAKGFHRERIQCFARISSGYQSGKESTKKVMGNDILERGKGFAMLNNTLEILPLHLKSFLQSSVGSLGLPTGSLGKLVIT